MPKYWGKNYFAHGSFPEMGQKQKAEEIEIKKERLNDGNNNGQAMHGARKPPGPICMAHTSTHGARKPPGPKSLINYFIKGNLYLIFKYLFYSFGRKCLLAQAACVRHVCLRAPCVAWPLLSPSFSLSYFFIFTNFQIKISSSINVFTKYVLFIPSHGRAVKILGPFL